MTSQTQSRRRGTLLGALLAVLLVTVRTGLLYARVALSGGPQPRPPLPVETVAFEQRDGFHREVSYLGVVAAGRKANLGFEVSGTLDSAPPRPGTPVRAGEIIATLDQSSLRAQRASIAAQLEQARAELELANIKAERQRDLVASGAVSREAHDDTRLRARALEAGVVAVSAQLQSTDIDLQKSSLRAPYDGVIADRYVHQGAVVAPGEPVVRLVETAAREAHIGVAARRASALEPGKRYPLRLRDSSVDALLLSVRPDVNPRTRATTAVFALPENIQGLDGEAVSLVLEERVDEIGGWIPLSALQEGARGIWTVLRLVEQDGHTVAVREAVEVVDVRADRAFVRGTLPDGSLVVASGVHRVTPGTPLTVAGGQ